MNPESGSCSLSNHISWIEVERLRALSLNPILLNSERYNREKLRDSMVAEGVKETFGTYSKALGGYRKRIIGSGKAYVTHREFCNRVAEARPEKLAKMPRTLSFLTQTKVYLLLRRSSL